MYPMKTSLNHSSQAASEFGVLTEPISSRVQNRAGIRVNTKDLTYSLFVPSIRQNMYVWMPIEYLSRCWVES